MALERKIIHCTLRVRDLYSVRSKKHGIMQCMEGTDCG